MGAQRVDAAVGGRAVGAERALRGVRVEVVPAVGHLLAAGLAAPEGGTLRGRHEHAVVRVLQRVCPLCKTHRVTQRFHPTPSFQYFATRSF